MDIEGEILDGIPLFSEDGVDVSFCFNKFKQNSPPSVYFATIFQLTLHFIHKNDQFFY